MTQDAAVLVDSHCHIDFPDLADDVIGVLARMHANDVRHALCVSVTWEDFPRVRALALAHECLSASVGVHPDTQDGHDPTVAELVREGRYAEVVAIGETGLDYFRATGNLDWQRARLRTHVRAARELSKPLIIHCREAAPDLLSILKEEHAEEVGGVMHCFTESWEVAAAAMEMNFMISFSGIVTFKSAAALREVAARVPDDRILVETDSPYLAPVPHRGQVNQPAFVRHVAEELARVRGVDLSVIARQTTTNFQTLFNAFLG
jgi:TatD DNase family protein